MIINNFFNYFQERIACVINPKNIMKKWSKNGGVHAFIPMIWTFFHRSRVCGH